MRYFFYITNRRDLSVIKVVELASGRCNQENVNEQLRVNAMRMPVDNLTSHRAYMVMAALAWDLKAWFGLLVPCRGRGMDLVRMEFKRFLQRIVLLPARIEPGGLRVIFRILNSNFWLKDFFVAWERIQQLGVSYCNRYWSNPI